MQDLGINQYILSFQTAREVANEKVVNSRQISYPLSASLAVRGRSCLKMMRGDVRQVFATFRLAAFWYSRDHAGQVPPIHAQFIGLWLPRWTLVLSQTHLMQLSKRGVLFLYTETPIVHISRYGSRFMF
jgi:hypothetical protein